MTESKFTKGPWTVEVVAINPLGLGLVNEYQIVAQRPGANENFGDAIATVHTVDELDGDKANANLLASAPELYEALSGMMAAMKTNDVDAMARFMTIGIDALAKAEGRS